MLSKEARGRFLRLSLLLSVCLLIARAGTASLVLTLGQNFTAGTYGIDINGQPPDASIAVSSNYVVEFVNTRFSIYTKGPVSRVKSMSDLSFWSNAGVTFGSGQYTSDPRMVFDTASQRWFAAMIDVNSAQISNRFLVAISATADPNGLWRAVSFPADPVTGYFADFPTLGLDADGVYLSGDMFNSAGNSVGPLLVSIPKADLLLAPPTATNRTSSGVLSYSSYGAILQPSVCLSGHSPGVILAAGDLGYDFNMHSNLVGVAIQNVTAPHAAVLSGPTSISIPPYSVPINPQQPGASQNVDDGDARISSTVYRVGSFLYAVHGTEVDSRAAIQWFKLDASTFVLLDTGIISDPVLDLFYPSIVADTNGTVVIAFNGSSTSSFISSYAILGEPINGSLSFGNMVLLKGGADNYMVNSTSARWGDYSAVCADPAKPNHFWALTMYPSSGTAFSTQITELIASPLNLSINNSGGDITISWPNAAAGYQLYSSPSLDLPVWTLVSQSPFLNNDLLTVDLGIPTDIQYFRLVK